MSSLALLGLEWSRPLGLATLALPLVVWWLARRARGAPVEATGTLEVWREIAREHRPASRGRRTSPAVWLVIAALACGALALAGPRAARAKDQLAWRVAVDRSPSMYLPHDGTAGSTRLEVALARVEALLDATRASGDAIEWLASDGESARGERPPAAWSSAPQAPLPELDWSALDTPGTWVVTDRAPPNAPLHAALVASGGAAAPGAIAAAGRDLIVWNGAQLETRAGQAPALRAHVARTPGVEPILRVVDAWAASRGVAIDETGPCELELEFVVTGAARALEAGRDGWSASGSAVAVTPERASTAWLSARVDGEQLDVVRWRPGRVAIGWRTMEEPRGDLAAFAVSWSQLFDAALLPPPGVVALEERQAAGAASERAPEDVGSSNPDSGRMAAVLAGCAALFAFAALALRR